MAETRKDPSGMNHGEKKRQYHLEMAGQIAAIPENTVPHLLLHSCCGPCSTAVLEQLVPYFAITLLFYNPNIAPEEEYGLRLEMQKKVIAQISHPHPITLLAPPYDPAPFREAVRGVEDTPEAGERCRRCIAQRMREAAQIAKERACDYFTTTLSVSPHKNAPYINACGEALAAEYGVRFLPSDFKKKGGYARSVALSQEYGLYRQDYCGCPMSLREAEARRSRQAQNAAEDAPAKDGNLV